MCYGDYYLPGYSRPNDGMIEAVQLLAQTEAILLDPVYSGKAFPGMIALIRKGVSNQTITIQGWNAATHNIVYGGTLTNFNKYVSASKPTSAQTTAARNEVFKKAALA